MKLSLKTPWEKTIESSVRNENLKKPWEYEKVWKGCQFNRLRKRQIKQWYLSDTLVSAFPIIRTIPNSFPQFIFT
jgi:hypothetical protein